MAVDYKALKSGGFMRQVQKDHFSMRLKVVGGNLTTEQFDVISAVAKQYGHGYIHLTSRQGIEIPFIRLQDIEEVKKALEDGGVFSGICGPRVRTVTACQGDRICPSGCIDTYDLAQDISARYFGRELPHKFKFGVTGCMNNCLKAEENDLGIKGGLEVSVNHDDCIRCGVCVKVCRENAVSIQDDEVTVDYDKCNYCGRCVKSCPTDAFIGESVYILYFGGTFGNMIAQGVEILRPVKDKETVFKAADAALSFYDRYGKPSERFRKSIEREGIEKFREYIIEKVSPSLSENMGGNE
ncbi:MAG: 4Fe-4S binding protein [Clostridiales bacterium]|jgi:dissimilatory sulfite reductase (desulfoviridin) alpha/beta subunit|nr:4Fe-4S binding protein [Clostridiales bacterium]